MNKDKNKFRVEYCEVVLTPFYTNRFFVIVPPGEVDAVGAPFQSMDECLPIINWLNSVYRDADDDEFDDKWNSF